MNVAMQHSLSAEARIPKHSAFLGVLQAICVCAAKGCNSQRTTHHKPHMTEAELSLGFCAEWPINLCRKQMLNS